MVAKPGRHGGVLPSKGLLKVVPGYVVKFQDSGMKHDFAGTV